MHIVENGKIQAGKIYCCACECLWDPVNKKYKKPSISVGTLDGNPLAFKPNNYFYKIISRYNTDPSSLDEKSNLILNTVVKKYGKDILTNCQNRKEQTGMYTALADFIGPQLVFGSITKKYSLDDLLDKSFGEQISSLIQSLAWFLASEGDALVNSDSWLEHFENPHGGPISSQDITRLLDSMSYDDIMHFYKQWLASYKNSNDKILYDLTSISYYGKHSNLAAWGHNRDNDKLPQVNYALLCSRNTGMPLFAWTLDGSISDVKTLMNTLQFLEKLDYKPNCLMMDRGFSSDENITFMLKQKHTFLQAMKISSNWIKDIISLGRKERFMPESMYEVGNRTYYINSTPCRWVCLAKTSKRGKRTEKTIVIPQKSPYINSDDDVEVLAQYSCTLHVLFCQDLVGKHRDRFMKELGKEHKRLMDDDTSEPSKEFKNFFIVTRKKYQRGRTIEYNMDYILNYQDTHSGHICFLSNDKTIDSAEMALKEYSTRDYIEKDFDEMKNDLDMKRIRVHTDSRMEARLFIQLIAEIYMREIRVALNNSPECMKLTRSQVFNKVKAIYRVKFAGKYRYVYPSLSRDQRCIFNALGIKYPELRLKWIHLKNRGDLRS
ncbi:MAG: IS1634 family transposase [Deltaproteobacteria bacterium]|jgi:transposase|nr:IS1634 family transposase [Deltaproteobacteria bacterium]